MTIDTKELRMLVQEFKLAGSPMLLQTTQMNEILDRLEAAEKERDVLRDRLALESQENGALRDSVDRACEERDALRAKIEEMERQEPVAYLPLSSARILESGVIANAVVWNCRDKAASDMPLYALPGAQPAPSIPDDVMRDAKRYRFLRAAKNIPISTEAARDPIVYDAAIDAAMLAAAPEAKP